MSSPASEPVEVTGYLAGNWGAHQRPAVVLRDGATVGELVAWCWAEACSLQAAAEAIGSGGTPVSSDTVSCVFLHRLAPLANVLEHVGSRLALERGIDEVAPSL